MSAQRADYSQEQGWRDNGVAWRNRKRRDKRPLRDTSEETSNQTWKKKMNERADSSHSCLLFHVISSSLGVARILGAGPLLEFTVQWANRLIKHMWTCRGMGRVTVLRTALLSAAQHARAHARAGKKSFNMQKLSCQLKLHLLTITHSALQQMMSTDLQEVKIWSNIGPDGRPLEVGDGVGDRTTLLQ